MTPIERSNAFSAKRLKRMNSVLRDPVEHGEVSVLAALNGPEDAGLNQDFFTLADQAIDNLGSSVLKRRTVMSTPTGTFVWYELMTPDAQAAEAFYGKVVGWCMRDAGMPDFAYTILSVGERPVGGLMALPDSACQAGARPGWIGHVAVDDVDVFAARLKEAGGSVHRPPTDIPGIGRFAVVADPHGAKFVLFDGSVEGQDLDPALGTPGYPGWRELHAGDLASAFAFYSGLFGWTKDQAIDMGPMGIYQLFAIEGVQAGGMMTKSEKVPAPFWLYYFNVDAIDAAASRVREAGGELINGPHEVPGGSWIIQCLDPQGVTFALVGPKG